MWADNVADTRGRWRPAGDEGGALGPPYRVPCSDCSCIFGWSIGGASRVPALPVAAALRARELDPDAEVTVVLADAYPNFSACGLPYAISGEVAR